MRAGLVIAAIIVGLVLGLVKASRADEAPKVILAPHTLVCGPADDVAADLKANGFEARETGTAARGSVATAWRSKAGDYAHTWTLPAQGIMCIVDMGRDMHPIGKGA